MQELPDFDSFLKARDRLQSVLVKTPLLPHRNPASQLWLKPEMLQPSGSFKIRGVFNAVASMPDHQRAKGVKTVSAGNTAQALSWTARHFGIQARVLMPESAPKTKIEAVRRYGAQITLLSRKALFEYLDAESWREEPEQFVHPWTDGSLLSGHGSLAFEILEDCPDLETVFVPIGGGGLAAGVGLALCQLRPRVHIVGVEPQGCPALYKSLEANRSVAVDCQTLADGVAVPRIADEMFPLLQDLVERVLLVSEPEIRQAIRRLARHHNLIAEGAGALALAAATALSPDQIGPSVCLLTGGGIDFTELQEIIGPRSGPSNADHAG